MTPLQLQLTSALPDFDWKLDEPLAPRTYAKIGGPAELFVAIKEATQAIQLLSYCAQQHVPYTILGGASNVLIADQGIPGVVFQYTDDSVKPAAQQPLSNKTLVHIGAGSKTALAVSKTVELGLTGLEYFLGVPGTIGGAIYNNAHYLTDLIDAHIHRVHAVSRTGTERWLTHAECDFGYEQSRFQSSGELILGAEFALELGDRSESQAKIAHATQYRANTQPLGIPSSGCMFRNPPNTEQLKQRFPQFADKAFIPAGFLIDQAGLKGERVGGVSVSQKHAAWIINEGNGTSADVAELVQKIKKHIAELFGVKLETEVFFLPHTPDKLEREHASI